MTESPASIRKGDFWDKVLQSGTIRVGFEWKSRDMLQNCSFCNKLIGKKQKMLYFHMPHLYAITLCKKCATEGGFPWISHFPKFYVHVPGEGRKKKVKFIGKKWEKSRIGAKTR